MLVLLPINRCQVSYYLQGGRPYGVFERLVLEAVAGGVRSVQGLQEVFQIHQRLLVEALVTLTRAGWLAFGDDSTFDVTSEGAHAIDGGNAPTEATQEGPLDTYILAEQLTGGIARAEYTYVTTYSLENDGLWQQAIRLRPTYEAGRPQPGEVAPFIKHKADMWVGLIESVLVVGQGSQWLPMEVKDGAVDLSGLPPGWALRIREDVAEQLQTHKNAAARALTVETRRASVVMAASDRFAGMSDDHWIEGMVVPTEALCWNYDDHDELLSAVLQEAEGNVLVASAFVSPETIGRLTDRVAAAVSRGVTVDLLWGLGAARDAGAADVLSCLRKLKYDCGKGPGRVSFNERPVNSHAKVLLWKTGERHSVAIGSYDWLSTAPSEGVERNRGGVSNVTVAVHRPEVFRRVADLLADVWQRAEEDLLPVGPSRWRALAIEAQSAAQSLSGALGGASRAAAVVSGRDHLAILAEMSERSRSALVIVSHQLGPVASLRLGGLFSRSTPRDTLVGAVLYGEAKVDADTLRQLEHQVSECGVELRQRLGLHAKVILSDDRLCVGSYNFLSTDAHDSRNKMLEISLVADLADPSAVLWRLSGA